MSSAEVVSHLAALTRLARHAQAAFEGKSEEITAFLLTSVLLKEVVDTNEVGACVLFRLIATTDLIKVAPGYERVDAVGGGISD